MFRTFVLAIALAIAITGCSERFALGVPHAGKVLQDLDPERPAIPSEDRVMTDLKNKYGAQLPGEIVSKTIDAESHTFFVIVENGDPEAPDLFKVTYFLIEDEWYVLCERM